MLRKMLAASFLCFGLIVFVLLPIEVLLLIILVLQNIYSILFIKNPKFSASR